MQKNNLSPLAPLFSQAEQLERAGKFEQAKALYQNILAQDKKNPKALTLLGLMYIKNQESQFAISLFEKAIKAAPKATDPLNNLAMLHINMNRPDKAEKYALAAYKIDNKSPLILKTLFKCYYHLNKPKKAQSYIKKALDLQPNNPEFKLDLAQSYDTTGAPGKAKAIFEELLNNNHKSLYAYDGLARSQTYKNEPPEYAEIVTLAKKAKTKNEKKWLYRTAGKIQDDIGNYDLAFEHFTAGKDAERAIKQVEMFSKNLHLIEGIFDSNFFSERKKWGSPSKRPIFVFGMPRSGTTLVEQILASHTKVHGANELEFFLDEINKLKLNTQSSDTFKQSLNNIKTKDAQSISKEYLQLLIAYSNSTERVVDKMPGNFEALWLMALLFPNATFIHCKRDPIATCTSCYIQPFGDKLGYADDLESLGEYYKLYERLMNHWKSVLPIKIVDTHYESLIANQESESRKLLAAAGLEWDDNCLEFYNTKRGVRTPSRRQVEQPIYSSALDKWRRYEKHLNPLQDALSTQEKTEA